ncbi:hypothetical protein GE061_004579 [Apolygus lucorum]|uniref:Menorin-like domain-containing protein n=1 Tax=Apolygus lucorum TaxID=248454 RepID=A0A6A4INM0_APOLU|nr:hypothetical protein GE061_004579 [Apolygus lucorum]
MLGATKPYHFEGDLTKVIWARCLAKDQVIKAFYEPRVCMITVEIIMGLKKDSHQDKMTPVIAHPPETTPEWDIEEFFRMFVPVIEDTTTCKGIKLDFRCKEAFAASLPTMRMIFSTRKKQFPIWLHADIFAGPGARDQTPVDPTLFISEVVKFPQVVVSLGWTTSTNDETGYTAADIDAMLDFLNHHKLAQPVVVMIRATLIVPSSSYEGVVRLMHGAKTHTSLAVWAAPPDQPDANVVKKLLKEVGHRKVYLDLPRSIIEEIRFAETSPLGNPS